MTEADMVAAVSQVYGPPGRRTPPSGQVGSRPQQLEDTVIAEWTYGAHHVSLLAVAGPAGFRMIVASAPLEALALAAGVREAPAELRERTDPASERRANHLRTADHTAGKHRLVHSLMPRPAAAGARQRQPGSDYLGSWKTCRSAVVFPGPRCARVSDSG